MKKLLLTILLHLIIYTQSCVDPCGEYGRFTTAYTTIESVSSIFFSFDENGSYPYQSEYNRNEIGIGIYADSITEEVVISKVTSGIVNSAVACSEPFEHVYKNKIDSVNIYTKFNFDKDHVEGDMVNDLLNAINIDGTLSNSDIESLSIIESYFKFTKIPENDSMQFIIKGRIVDRGYFEIETELVVLEN